MNKSEKIAVALIKKAIELKKAGVYNPKPPEAKKKLLRVLVLSLLVLAMSACAGIGFKMEGYRIDELQASQKTYPKPLKCLFTSCPEWDTQRAGEGS